MSFPEISGSQSPKFDVLTATGQELQKLLDEESTTSQELIEIYFQQIEKHNHFGMRLNAIISTAPRDDIMKQAKVLDAERTTRKRGPLHGIPIIIKVCDSRSKRPMFLTQCGIISVHLY